MISDISINNNPLQRVLSLVTATAQQMRFSKDVSEIPAAAKTHEAACPNFQGLADQANRG